MNVSKMCIDEQPQEEQSSSFMEGQVLYSYVYESIE